jgi:uncharacterized protein (TIGR00730 family)
MVSTDDPALRRQLFEGVCGRAAILDEGADDDFNVRMRADIDVQRISARPQWAVCVYCASGPTDPNLLALATDVGESIAERGWTLVSGGGSASAMGAIANGARACGGHTVGVMPKALVQRELADVDAGELIVTDTMRERKQIMDQRSDAFLTLAGGIGTLEELFEAWTASSHGMHDKPVVMLDPHGHYDGLLGWLGTLVDTGYVRPAALARLVVTRSLEEALAACAPRGDFGHLRYPARSPGSRPAIAADPEGDWWPHRPEVERTANISRSRRRRVPA